MKIYLGLLLIITLLHPAEAQSLCYYVDSTFINTINFRKYNYGFFSEKFKNMETMKPAYNLKALGPVRYDYKNPDKSKVWKIVTNPANYNPVYSDLIRALVLKK